MPDLRRMRAAWAAAMAAGLLVTAAPAVAASPAATVTAPSGAATAAKASRAVAKPTSTTAAKTTAKPRAAAASRPRATTQPKATAKPKDTPKGKKPKPKKPKPPAKPVLSGWLAPAAAAFPQRAVTLLTAPHRALSSSALTLTENGAPVTPFTLSPLSQGQPGDFGLDLVVDRSTAMGAPSIDAALVTARQLASARVGAQQLGLIVFAARPAAELPLTSSSRRIDLELQANPAPAAGDDLLAAEELAVDQVQRAGVARGAVLAVADATAVAGQVQALQALHDRAAAAGITVVTVELGAGSGSSAVAGRAAVPPAVVPATVATLPAVVASLRQQLTSGYVLRYRSPAGHHAAVDVAVSATGFTGSIHGAYISPAAPPPAPVRHSAAPKHRDTLDLSTATPLSKTPPFVALPLPPPPAPAPVGFWASSAAVPAVALLCALLIAAAVALAVHRPSKSALRERVGDFLPVEAPAYDPSAPAPRRPKGPLRALQRGSWWPPFVEAVAASRNPRSPAELVRRAAAAGLVLAVLLTFVSGSVLLGLLPLLAWPFVLRALVFRAAEKQRSRFRDTLPVYLQDLGSSIRVGRSLVSALAAVTENADEPTKSEFERAVTDEALGRPLEECLEQIGVRMDSRDMSQVALIAGLNRKSGANIAESLDRVAEGARERADLHREMKALTAQAKMSSLVLTSLPAVLLVGLSVISPRYAHPLLHTTLGIVAIAFGAVLVFAGWKVMQKITNVGAL